MIWKYESTRIIFILLNILTIFMYHDSFYPLSVLIGKHPFWKKDNADSRSAQQSASELLNVGIFVLCSNQRAMDWKSSWHGQFEASSPVRRQIPEDESRFSSHIS